MKINYYFFIVVLLFLSCQDKDEIQLSENNLEEYLQINVDKVLDEVISCAASSQENSKEVLVYYYPITGSSEYRYYETETTDVDPNDFSNYTLKELPTEPVLGGKLAKFSRNLNYEAWGVVTFLTEGRVHKSNPIRLKQLTNPTQYSSDISIDFEEENYPLFKWSASDSKEDIIYFQALIENEGDFISGTYTTDLFFKYYDTSNVVLDINTELPTTLEPLKEYIMNIMGVSIDNWVNLHLIKTF